MVGSFKEEKNHMERFRKLVPVLAVLCGLGMLGGLAPHAHAGILVTNDPVITDLGGGHSAFDYGVSLGGASYLHAGDYFTMYDVGGLVAADTMAAALPAGWAVSIQNTGTTPAGLAPVDSGSVPNVTFTYSGPNITTPGSTAVSLGTFRLVSTGNDTMAGVNNFTSLTHYDSSGHTGQLEKNIANFSVPVATGKPNDTPEPATLLMLGLGLPFVGVAALRRRAPTACLRPPFCRRLFFCRPSGRKLRSFGERIFRLACHQGRTHMTRCLVTGGAGFIGSHLTEALVARGHKVRVLDNFSTGSWENLAPLRDRLEVVTADLTELSAVRGAAEGMEVIFHQGALASVPRSVADPVATHEACATGTLQVLMAAKEVGVRRVVYAASSSAYGASLRLPKRETDPTLPLSPYAVAKLTGEHYCAAFTHVHGLETVRLRYFNVFGPRQPPDSPYSAVIPLFIKAMLEGRRPRLHGDGEQSRDFTFVADVVEANLLAAVAPGVAGRVYNIACGRRTSLLDLVARLNALLGTNLQPLHEAPRAGDVRHSQADISAAQKDLGYQPRVDMDEGLRRTVDYLKDGSGDRRQNHCAC
jgi:UDP-glucose 4-epimerase